MKRAGEKDKKNRGSLTVEAILFLIPFMCAFFTLINAARFVQAEMLIHHAITQTAKQISTYSYVLTKAEITQKMQESNGKSEKFLNTVEGATTSIQGLVDAFNNRSELADGVFSLAKSSARDVMMRTIAGELARKSIENSIRIVSDDPDGFLTNIGVVGGLSGLDFSKSQWVSTTKGKADIRIVVTYKMKNSMFPDFDFGQYEYCQCASTLIW